MIRFVWSKTHVSWKCNPIKPLSKNILWSHCRICGIQNALHVQSCLLSRLSFMRKLNKIKRVVCSRKSDWQHLFVCLRQCVYGCVWLFDWPDCKLQRQLKGGLFPSEQWPQYFPLSKFCPGGHGPLTIDQRTHTKHQSSSSRCLTQLKEALCDHTHH